MQGIFLKSSQRRATHIIGVETKTHWGCKMENKCEKQMGGGTSLAYWHHTCFDTCWPPQHVQTAQTVQAALARPCTLYGGWVAFPKTSLKENWHAA